MDNKALIIIYNNEIYLIDIRNMMTKKKLKFLSENGEIKSLDKKDKDIYLNFGNYIYLIRYNKYNLEFINIKVNILFTREEYIYPSSIPTIAKLEKEICLINNEIKFFTFKLNKYALHFKDYQDYFYYNFNKLLSFDMRYSLLLKELSITSKKKHQLCNFNKSTFDEVN